MADFGVAEYAAIAGLTATVASIALAPRPQAVNMPAIPKPAPMPVNDPNDPNVRRTSIQAQLLRRGRLSTILSQGENEPLGG